MIATAAIDQKVQALAMQLLLDGEEISNTSEWSEALMSLSQAAEMHNRQDVAALAREVAGQLAGPMAAASAHQSLASGIGRLQEALTERPMKLSLDRELIGDFAVESREHLISIEGLLLALEQDAQDMEAIHSVFRSFHTIKGLAGFLELEYVQQVAHEVETLLDHARESRLIITPPVIDVVLESTDYLNRWIRHLENSPFATAPAELSENEWLLRRILDVSVPSQLPLADARGPEAPILGEARESASKRSGPSRSVKVDTDKLDYLVDMVGEMVIAQSVIRHDPDLIKAQKPQLTRNFTQLTRITDEVQRTAMAMRMVPIGPLFQKMARLVRDLTRKFGKQAQLDTFGEEVQLDRNIVEELADPLMHMIRNAVDHGIETPEGREAASKNPVARIELKAFHLAGQIVIQISDDGRGLNRTKILAKAVKNGLIAANANPPDTECFNLIFHPGFSTAEVLSDVSGRGVGMDVVKKQIQKLRGSVDIQSTLGSGTTFSLKLPLTMAIIDGLVVGVGKERYIVPIFSVKEMLRPTAEMVSTIEGRAEVLMVRNNLLPVVRLYERFHIEPRSKNPEEAVFIVAEYDGKLFCLMVDELIGKQEVVIKALGPMFQQVSGIAGGAILGDGRIGLILDMQGVFHR